MDAPSVFSRLRLTPSCDWLIGCSSFDLMVGHPAKDPVDGQQEIEQAVKGARSSMPAAALFVVVVMTHSVKAARLLRAGIR